MKSTPSFVNAGRPNRRAVLGALVGLSLLSQPAAAAPPAASAPAPVSALKRVPSLQMKTPKGGENHYAVSINGFLVANGSWHDPTEIGKEVGVELFKPIDYFPIFQYYLKKGENTIEVTQLDESEKRPLGVELYLAETAAPEAMQENGKRIGSVAAGEILTAKNPKRFAFQLDIDLPAWDWLSGPRIEDNEATRASLLLAYKKLHDAIKRKDCKEIEKQFEGTASYQQALKNMGLQSGKVTRICDIATGRNQKPDDVLQFGRLAQPTAMRIFGNDHLAELLSIRHPILNAQGDVPGGRGGTSRGPTEVSFRLWFRKTDKGDWVLVR